MTGAEWLVATDPVEMLLGLTYDGDRPRKLALTGIAGCRHVWNYLNEEARQRIIEAEEFEDNSSNAKLIVSGLELNLRREEIGVVCLRELQRQASFSGASDLVRCIFGNPFRPATLDPNWRTSTVLTLAQGIYDERAFDRLPILADALQNAGCANEEMLAHCRGEGPHARGCWVVDLVLGKA